MREIWVWSLGWEDPLEKGKATHFSILAWRIPWTVQCMGLQRARHDWAAFTFTLSYRKDLPDIENRLVDTGGEGEGGTNSQSSMETYTLSCVKLDNQWKFAVWCRELKCSDPWWDPVRGVRKFQEGWDTCIPMAWFVLIYGRNQHNIVKPLSSNCKETKFKKKKTKCLPYWDNDIWVEREWTDLLSWDTKTF